MTPEKIDFAALERLLSDPEVPETALRPYVTGDRAASAPFAPRMTLNPETVETDPTGAENALSLGNRFSQIRRRDRFLRRRRDGDRAPILVSEGDSWFQFPIMITDVIDHLDRDFLIRSFGAAGDTAANMVANSDDCLQALRALGNDVRAFLFSAAGNDVIGQGADGRPALVRLVRRGVESANPADHVDAPRLKATLDALREAYRTMFVKIRAWPGHDRLPIVIHGYDYAIPGGPGDPRHPSWAAPDEWLGGPLERECGLTDPAIQRGVVRHMIDALYDMMDGLAGDPRQSGIHLVDARGCLPERTDWADEIHGDDNGFGRVAARFRQTIHNAIG